MNNHIIQNGISKLKCEDKTVLYACLKKDAFFKALAEKLHSGIRRSTLDKPTHLTLPDHFDKVYSESPYFKYFADKIDEEFENIETKKPSLKIVKDNMDKNPDDLKIAYKEQVLRGCKSKIEEYKAGDSRAIIPSAAFLFYNYILASESNKSTLRSRKLSEKTYHPLSEPTSYFIPSAYKEKKLVSAEPKIASIWNKAVRLHSNLQTSVDVDMSLHKNLLKLKYDLQLLDEVNENRAKIHDLEEISTRLVFLRELIMALEKIKDRIMLLYLVANKTDLLQHSFKISNQYAFVLEQDDGPKVSVIDPYVLFKLVKNGGLLTTAYYLENLYDVAPDTDLVNDLCTKLKEEEEKYTNNTLGELLNMIKELPYSIDEVYSNLLSTYFGSGLVELLELNNFNFTDTFHQAFEFAKFFIDVLCDFHKTELHIERTSFLFTNDNDFFRELLSYSNTCFSDTEDVTNALNYLSSLKERITVVENLLMCVNHYPDFAETIRTMHKMTHWTDDSTL